MINNCLVAEAGRLSRELAREGIALSTDFLHSDKHARNSLVWNAIEPLRARIARINARVFTFIASRELARADSPERDQDASDRMAHHGRIVGAMLLPDRDILDAAR